MKILLDTNVVLDLVLRRAPWVVEAERIWEAHRIRQIEACVSSSALTDIYYITKRLTDRGSARRTVHEILMVLTILTVDRESLIRADESNVDDFEDAHQMTVAGMFHCQAIVTRDERDFRGSPLKILSPSDLVVMLRPDPAPPGTESEINRESAS